MVVDCLVALLVLEGCLRLYRIMHDGRHAILGFSYAGELLGVSFRNIYPFTAEAVTPVRLRRLARHRFHELVDGSQDYARSFSPKSPVK